MEQGLKPGKKWLVTDVTFVPLLHPQAYLATLVITTVLKVHSWVRLLMNFLSPAACIALSSTVKASQQGRSSLVKTSLISLCSRSNVHAVFNTKVLPSSSGGEPRAIEITCIIWGGESCGICDQQLERRWPTLGTGIFICQLSAYRLFRGSNDSTKSI